MPAHDGGAVRDDQQQDQGQGQHDGVAGLGEQDDPVRRRAQEDPAEHAGQQHETPEQAEAAAPQVGLPAQRAPRRVGGGERRGDRRGQAGGEESDPEEQRRRAAEQRFEARRDRRRVGRVGALSEQRRSGDHHRRRDQAPQRHRAEGVLPALADVLFVAARVRPPFEDGAGVEEQVVGNHRGADQRQHGEQRARRHPRDQQPGKQLARVGRGEDRGQAEHHAHQTHQGDQRVLDRPVGAGHQQGAGQRADDRHQEPLRKPGEQADAEGRSEQVAGLERRVAGQDGRRDEAERGRPDPRVRQAVAYRLGEAAPSGEADPRRHVLQDDGGDHREQDGPEQGGAVPRAGPARGDQGSRSDEGGGDQETRPDSKTAHDLDPPTVAEPRRTRPGGAGRPHVRRADDGFPRERAPAGRADARQVYDRLARPAATPASGCFVAA